MNRIEQLIEELCPNGVEFKELSMVVEIGTGSSNGNEATDSGKYPLYVRSKIVKRIDTFEFDEEAIIIPGEGGIGEIFHYINGKYALHQRAYRIKVISSEISTKFLCYYMMSNFKEFILQKAVNATVISIRKPMIAKFPIPIPPLPIQQEIVTILDAFTDLDASLQAELEARRKQYEHYRNQLLNFEGKEVEWKTLGEISDVTKLAGFEFTAHIKYADKGSIIALRGLNVKNGSLDLSNVKYIDNSNFSKLTRSKLLINDMLFTYVGTVGDVALIDTNNKFYLAPNVSRIRFMTDKVIPRLIMHYFQTFSFKEKQINKYLAYSSLKNLTMENIRKFQIPIPPLSEQERIVGILDKFDALVNTELPAEIAARRKQYEYYREKLLTFEPLAN